jgi:hypothetical protein
MRDLLFTNASDWRSPLQNENMRDVIGRQLWISVYSNTGRGIDIIISLNVQEECFFNSRGEIKLKIFPS